MRILVLILFILTEAGATMAQERTEGPSCAFPKNDEELQKLLSPEQYRVMKQNGTERPFENAYYDNKKPGLYVDAISGEPLFSSTDKFESGTGWPSFTKPLSRLIERTDRSFGTTRTEVRSAKSDSHLGHVFEDGPAPTGLRYCINSASLRFVPVEKMAEEGYGEYLYLFASPGVQTETAIFAAGCFWGVEERFRNIPGVINTTAGYTGGTTEDPSYKEVCTDRTGHAEAVRVEFDPSKVTYEQLLEAFFNMHNPTTLNRQGPDVGTQYRSVIFTHSEEQEEAARRARESFQKSGRFSRPIVTEIVPESTFYPAEEYHQRYLEKQGLSSCASH